ncbi:MAG TPA: GntR family transcriptional regulator [Pseudonocardiaceae bacterium]
MKTPQGTPDTPTSTAEPRFGPLGEPRTRTDLVVNAIKAAILNGSLPTGQSLSERDLAARLNVSKTPVREALKLLRATGLVEVGAYQQVNVRRIDGALVNELYQARLLIEPHAVGLAVLARGHQPTPEATSALADARSAAAADDLATVSLANRRFHRLLYAQCGNRFLIDQLDQLQDLTALAATVGWRHSRTDWEEADEHAAVLAAFEEGDSALANDLMRHHIGAARTHILELLNDAK